MICVGLKMIPNRIRSTSTSGTPSSSSVDVEDRSMLLPLPLSNPSANSGFLTLQSDQSSPNFKNRSSVLSSIKSFKAPYYKMDNVNDYLEPKRTVFVTVGTTSFDSLVRTVDFDKVKKTLSKKGYTHLAIQMGRGSYIPKKSSGEDGSLVVDYFTFSSSIADYLRSASLIISHAGSGSIFETLRIAKPLIVVVNEDLMDNHQSELAEELAERKHLFVARPQTLCEVIESLDLDIIVPYEAGDANPVAKLINKHLGFSTD